MYVLGRKRQDEMIARGWSIKVKNSCFETTEEFETRLKGKYKKVKLYEDTTMVRGLHEVFAMVKD